MREQAIELRLDLRRPLARLGEFERVLNVLREATSLAETLGDRGRLAYISSYMADYLRLLGDYDRALAAGQRALVLAEALRDGPLETMTCEHLGVIHYYLGDYDRATDMLRRSVGSFKDVSHCPPVARADADAVESRSRLVFCLAEIGAFAEGSTVAEEGMRMAEALNHPLSLARAYCGAGVLYLLKGDLPQAMRILERGLAVCDAWNISDWRVPLASRLGYTYALCGRVTEALPLLEQAVEHARHTDSLVYLAAASLQAGRLDEAYTQAQRALEFSRAQKERGHEAYALRLLGEIHARHDPPEAEPAEAYYRQALTLAEALGMRPLQAHCHLGLGTLYTRTGQQQQARAELSTTIGLYRAMEMTFWLLQAEAALAQVA
jgi:tetratricopeptide (TPR) repeat protein